MKKANIFALTAAAVLLLWAAAFITDYVRVSAAEIKPVFCINTDGGRMWKEYTGAGYRFVLEYTTPVVPGPTKQSYVLYIFGNEVENRLIN